MLQILSVIYLIDHHINIKISYKNYLGFSQNRVICFNQTFNEVALLDLRRLVEYNIEPLLTVY